MDAEILFPIILVPETLLPKMVVPVIFIPDTFVPDIFVPDIVVAVRFVAPTPVASRSGVVILEVAENTGAITVPVTDRDDVKIELVSTTGLVILFKADMVEADTLPSMASTDPRVYTGDPN